MKRLVNIQNKFYRRRQLSVHRIENFINKFIMHVFDSLRMKQMADEGIHVATAPKEYGPEEDAPMMIDHLVAAYLRHPSRPSSDVVADR